MALRQRAMPTFQFQRLNPSFQSDPRRILGQTLMGQGASTAPVRTPLQGLGRLSSSLVGAFLQREALEGQAQRETAATEALMGMLPENVSPQVRAAVQAAPGSFEPAIMASMLQPTTKSEIVDQGDMAFVQTTTQPLIGPESTSISGLTQRRAAGDGRTSAQKNAEAMGYVVGSPEYNEFIRKSAAPDRTTNINMTNAPGSKATVDLVTKIGESAATAQQTLGRVDQMLDLLDAGVETGFGEEFLTGLRRVGQLFNPDFSVKDVAGAEAFTANANALIGPLVKQLGSNPTDKDLNFFVTASPTLSKSVEGNRLLLKALKLSQRREIILNEATNEFIRKNPNLDQKGLFGLTELQNYLIEVRNTHPVFTDGGQALVAEYTALTGEEPPSPTANNSTFDSLVNQGFISPTTN